MELFIKEINGIKYTVYYTYEKVFGGQGGFDVTIKKSTYKKLKEFSSLKLYNTLLNEFQLRSIIENELCMPLV